MSARVPALLAAATVVATMLTGFPGATAAPEQATQPQASQPRAVTFEDNFDGASGTSPDGSKWQLETGDNVNNHERQYYTNSPSNASLDGNGNLVITARRENPGNYQCWYGPCEYTSARLNTSGKFTQTYGTFEARIKMSRGQGMWPAFWLLGDNIGGVGWPECGEIDAMENIGSEPSTVHGTLHGPEYSGGAAIGAPHSIGGNFFDDFHTFTVDWRQDRITWAVDGNVYQTRTPADLGGRRWVFDHPFFMILNLAVGGYWPGDPDANTPFPNSLVIDYVRVTD